MRRKRNFDRKIAAQTWVERARAHASLVFLVVVCVDCAHRRHFHERVWVGMLSSRDSTSSSADTCGVAFDRSVARHLCRRCSNSAIRRLVGKNTRELMSMTQTHKTSFGIRIWQARKRQKTWRRRALIPLPVGCKPTALPFELRPPCINVDERLGYDVTGQIVSSVRLSEMFCHEKKSFPLRGPGLG